MPRKGAGRKGGARSARKGASTEAAGVEQEVSPRKAKEENVEGERARRSSTAAQTAASEAESRTPRSRRSRRDSTSPTEGRKSKEEAQPTRPRSSRRNAGKVNYKESDGEEDASTKNEDNFESNEEYDDSDSDERHKPKSRRGAKSPPKLRASVGRPRGRGRGGGSRGRPHKRSRYEDDDDEEEEEEVMNLSEDSNEGETGEGGKEKVEKTKEEHDHAGRKRSRGGVKSDASDKPSRKSTRGSSVQKTDSSPSASKRPSRNRQVKKYTEVDEDFDEEKSEEEVKEEDKSENIEPSKKRKTESETGGNKRPKLEVDPESTQKEAGAADAKSSESDVKPKPQEEEPMEIDTAVSEADEAKVKDAEVAEKQVKTNLEGQSCDEPKPTEDLKTQDKSETNHIQTAESKNEDMQKVEESTSEIKSKAPSVIKSPEKKAVEEKTEDSSVATNCVQPVPVQDATFLSKEPVTNTSVNGEDNKSDAEAIENNFHHQNSSKENGASEDKQQKALSVYSDREYVSNKSLRADTMKGSLRVGFASYNLGSITVQKEKLLQELDKEVGIVCMQNVSKSLFHEVLESHFDALGFKSVTSWPKDSDIGLATFYNISVFRLNNHVETPVQTLVQKKLESSDLEEKDKISISGCLDRCGNTLFTQLTGIQEEVFLTVANVKIPSSTVSLHALQVTCLNQELARITENNANRVVLCGELNVSEKEVPYELLRHGKLDEQTLDALKDDSDAVQQAAIVKMLRSILHQPSLNLTSCYSLVLGTEATIPESKTTCPNLLWVSAEGIDTVGVVDLPSNYSERLSQGQVPLKADLAVTIPVPPSSSV